MSEENIKSVANKDDDKGAIEKSSSKNMREKIRKNKFIMDWVLPILSALILAILISKFLVFNVLVPTGSMIPTINEKDRLVVTKVYNPKNLERGDIVVFESKELNETLIKRLIGLPGDKIDIKNGVVSVNGEVLKEDYVKNNDKFTGSFEVPQGKYFFLGDNRAVSNDARRWQNHYIDESAIEGKAQLRIYPFNNFGKLK